MIESIEFKNFKALKDTTLPLSQLTVIIGSNGSGKSSVIQALQALKNPGTLEFRNIVSIGTNSSTVEVIINWGKPDAGKNTSVIWTSTNTRGPSHEGIGISEDIETQLNRNLASIGKFMPDAEAIATPVSIQPETISSWNGGNLAAVLDNLKDEDKERFELLESEFCRLMPEFDSISFETPLVGHKSLALRTRVGHQKISARELSQGNLIALALLSVAYLPNPMPLIFIDEPERGIHPRLLRDISDALNRLAYPESVGETRQPVQVIATTHSPYFLDLYKDFPEQIVIANKVGQEVKFERLSDRPHYEEIIQDASLGDAWYTGIFGGVPAHP